VGGGPIPFLTFYIYISAISKNPVNAISEKEKIFQFLI